MENLLFLGVPILKHIRVIKVSKSVKLWAYFPTTSLSHEDGTSVCSLIRNTIEVGIALAILEV